MRHKPLFKKSFIHLPISPLAWLIFIIFVIFCLQLFLFIDSRSHSVSDTFYGTFPYLVPAFLFYEWLANKLTK